MIHMKYQALFSVKMEKVKCKNLLSAAAMIGALKVNKEARKMKFESPYTYK